MSDRDGEMKENEGMKSEFSNRDASKDVTRGVYQIKTSIRNTMQEQR